MRSGRLAAGQPSLPRKSRKNRISSRILRFPRCLVLLSLLPVAAAADDDRPWRLQGMEQLPAWLALSGSYQLRYEWLDRAFRALDPGTDDLMVARLLLAAEARLNEVLRFGAELHDSRAWGSEAATPLGTDDVNALEPLQIYLGIRADRWLPEGDSLDLRLGRFTMQMGSNRFVARHIFRNTLQGFTGANVVWTRQGGPRVQAFVTRPVLRLPFDRASLEANDVEFDEDLDTVFWGAHVDRLRVGGVRLQAYLFGIDDADAPRRPTRNRNHLTAGVRLLGSAEDWSWEVESAFQFGSVRETLLPGDRRNLDHRALLLHASLGKRFDGGWQPFVELRFDYASGDDRLGDGSNETFDTLFGPIRFDYGPTGIYNALRRNNLTTPGVYVTVRPRDDISWETGYRAAWLASDTDRFGNTVLRDPSGNSGNFVGHQVETRARWELLPGNLQFELGGAVLFKGEFLENAPLAPDTGDTVYLYSQFVARF